MEERIRKCLESRNVKGDDLLNALDTVEDILSKDGAVTEEGYAILYHATSIQNYKAILVEKLMYGKEDGIFFSTKKDGEILGYGSEVLEVRIPVERLILDDEFDNELHYKIKVKPYQKVKIDC